MAPTHGINLKTRVPASLPMKGVDFFHPNPFLRPNTLSSTSPLQVLQSLLFPWNWVSCVFYQSSHLWSEGWLNYEGGNIGSLLLMVFEWKLMEVWLFWNLMFFFLPSFMLHLMYDSPSSDFWGDDCWPHELRVSHFFALLPWRECWSVY